MKLRPMILPLILFAAVPCWQFSQASETLTGDMVMDRVNARPFGGEARFSMQLKVTEKTGVTHDRLLEVRRKEKADAFRTLYQITSPSYLQGLGLIVNEGRTEHMQKFFPSTGQIVDVVTRGLSALATDFTCEDLKWRVAKRDYSFSLLERTQYAGHQVAKVEMRPKDVQLQKELGYSKAIGWVQEDQWLIVRADYYDGKGEIFKTFTGGDLEQIDGIWTLRRLTMLNHRARHSTEVRILNVAYHLSLSDEELDPINLLAAQQEPSRKSSPGLEEKRSK